MLGLAFMLFALTHTFQLFRLKLLLPDAVRLTAAAALIIGIGAMAGQVPLPGDSGGRALAAAKLAEISLACLLAAYPVVIWTGSVTAAEGAAVLSAFVPQRRSRDGRSDPDNSSP